MGLEEDSWMGLKEDFQMGLKEGSWVGLKEDSCMGLKGGSWPGSDGFEGGFLGGDASRLANGRWPQAAMCRSQRLNLSHTWYNSAR